MSALAKYDAARYALSVALEVDEVKDIRDKAEAMAAYARQAKDTELVQWATEIKVRAERRAGQMLAEMPKAQGELRNSSRSHDSTATKTLADIGITKNESSRWQKLAAVTDTQFEEAVSAAKEVAGEVTTAAMLRAAKACEPPKPAPKPIAKPAPVVEPEAEEPEEYTELDALQDSLSALNEENDRLNDQLAIAQMDATEEEKSAAHTTILALRAENKTLTATLRAVTLARDSLMEEAVQMKRQMAMQRKEIDKLKNNK